MMDWMTRQALAEDHRSTLRHEARGLQRGRLARIRRSARRSDGSRADAR